MSLPKLVIEEIDRDRFARIATADLGEKRILTPNFCTLIKNPVEFDIFMNLSVTSASTEHLGTYVMRIFDAVEILLPLIKSKGQINLEKKLTNELFNNFRKRTISLVEPAMEYLLHEFYFESFLRVSKKVPFSRPVINYLKLRESRKKNIDASEYKRWKRAYHTKFWYDLDRNPRRRNDMIGDFFKLESMCGSDVLIPPVPFISSNGLLDIALRINRISRAIATNRGECATYFLLQKSVLRNETMLNRIINFMENDPSTLTIFKFKNLALWESGNIIEKELYGKLMETMARIKEGNSKKLFMILESSFQSFPSASYGFDIVSTSMRAFDKDGKFGHTAYGAWFYEDRLWNINFENLPRLIKNSGGRLPCPCPDCQSIVSLDDISTDDWYVKRRRHYLNRMNALMTVIARAIREREIEHVRQRIINSEISNLKNLIPRFWTERPHVTS